LLGVEVVSLDMACTLFWEPGCDPKYGMRYTRSALERVLEYLESRGYQPSYSGDLYTAYREVWDRAWSLYPYREVWSKYILLRFLYKLGLRINWKLLDEVYDLFIRERVEHFTPLPRSEMLLSYLKSRGYTLVLTTATTSHDLVTGILKRHGYSEYFDLVFSTQLTGIPKTKPEFYAELSNTLDVTPSKIVHVGDSIESDVVPARATGLKTVYYGWRTLCRAVDPEPCITVLTELYGIL